MKKVKRSKTKEFFKGLAIAAAMTIGYGAFFSHTDSYWIKTLSQKKEFITSIDFEAYNREEQIGINSPTMKIEVEDKEIENWLYLPMPNIIEWHSISYAHALGFTPYYGNIETAYSSGKDKKEKKKKSALERIAEGDENLKDIMTKIKSPNFVVLRIKGNEKYYKDLKKKDPITFITKRTAQNVNDFCNKVVIEAEVPDNGDYEAHKKRIEIIKKVNPKFKIAVTLDKKEGYEESSSTWNPEKNKKYWEEADIIILEDYFSKPKDLEKSLKKFKEATQGKKKVWVRIVVGTKRINERGINDLESALKEYEQILNITKQYADGCIANDTNGIWLFSSNSPDQQERLKKTKQLYKVFRRIKIEKTYHYGGL